MNPGVSGVVEEGPGWDGRSVSQNEGSSRGSREGTEKGQEGETEVEVNWSEIACVGGRGNRGRLDFG